MNILFLSQPAVLHPIYDEFCAAAPPHYRIRLFDSEAPADPQFDGVDVVVEVGGAVATSALLDLGAASSLLLWQILGTGLDEVDVTGFLQRGIRLANTPGQFSAIALAEHALFLMLMFAKRFAESQDSLESEVLCVPFTSELAGRTLGLLGFGASARELAKRAKACEMRILAYDVVPVPDEEQEALGVSCSTDSDSLDRLFVEADFLSVHVPLTSTTRRLVDARALALMKPSAVIVNVSRGDVIDEAALVEALRAGHPAGAGLDVFVTEPLPPTDPLRGIGRAVVATPHVAGVTDGTARRRAGAAIENIARVERGLEPLFRVLAAE
jgi:phosphoglycerate dehydrogenase-like enzyme